MLELQTRRMVLYALTQEQLGLALNDTARLAAELKIAIRLGVFSEESRQAMMIKMSRMEHAERDQHPWYTYFLMVRTADRNAMGVCGFKGAPTLFGSVELGYAIHEDFRNQGLMTESVEALVDWAFTHEACRQVTAETLRDNFASQHVLLKNGLSIDRSDLNMLYWKIDREHWRIRHGNGRDHPAVAS